MNDSPLSSLPPTEPLPPLLRPDWQGVGRLADAISTKGVGADLWYLQLERIQAEPELLGQAELARAQGLLTPEARHLALALRTAVRRILAAYLGLAPETLVFASRAKGKPCLQGQGQGLRFNLSHSRGKALLAVSEHAELGVDLEWPRQVPRLEAIAERLFEPAIFQHLHSLPDSNLKEAAFTQAWVCLEARQKLSGAGLFGKRLSEPHRLWLYGLKDGGLIALAQAMPLEAEPRLLCWPA